MKNRNTKPEMEHPYRRFGMAVAIYVIGVFGFSTWSYFAHRADPAAVHLPEFEPNNHLGKVAFIEGLEGLFLLAMAFILIALYHRARTQSMRQMEKLNAKLRTDFEQLKKHDTALEDAIQDLERFNAMATGREQRVLELKAEVNALLQEMNQPKRYNTVPAE